jgi:hypothetical protein
VDNEVTPPTSAQVSPTDHPTEAPAGPIRLACLVIGWGVIVFALHGILEGSSTSSFHLFRLLIGLNLFNDAVAIPVVLGISLAVRRFAPDWAKAPAQVALFVSGMVVLYAYPLVGGFGRTSRTGYSRLPFDYSRNLLVVLGLIWLCCGLFAAWRHRQQRVAR